jgi:selenocysteine lyase/cysteine desulfurase
MAPPLARSLFDLMDTVWALHCAEGMVPRAAVEAVKEHLSSELRPWELSHDDWLRPIEAVRGEAARLLGGEPADFTITSSTSGALTLVAQSFPWRPGDEVLAPLGEFPSNVWPWKALEGRGVRFREVPLWDGHLAGQGALESTAPAPGIDPEARLLAAIGPRTRILTLSWVRFQDGLRLDLRRLAEGCAERDVELVVDAIQGAGTVRADLSGLAAFATGVHKGLLAPQGAGLLWTSPDFRARLSPMGSWLSVEDGGDFKRPVTDLARAWLADGRKLEQGGPGGLLLVAVAESLRTIRAAGVEAIASHVDALQARLLSNLRGPLAENVGRLDGLRSAGRLGSILSFHHRGAGAQALQARVSRGYRKRIFTSAREGYLRVALHGWHDEEDLARLVAWLSEPAGG